MKLNPIFSFFLSVAALTALTVSSGSVPSEASEGLSGAAIAEPSASTSSSSSSGGRNFYQVLDDVLGDFEFDLKNGTVSGLKDLAIRNVALSENIPPSFRSHLELLITETVLKNTKTRVIECLPCRAKRAKLNGDQIIVSSNETNPLELARIAKTAGISRFLDVAFTFEPNGIVLSMFITDPENDSILWSRSYNSETSRAAAFRRGVDYNQIDQAHQATEYVPTVQHRLLFYYLQVPSSPSTVGCLGLGYRMMERYDNRKKEVGFEASTLSNASTLVNPSSASKTDIYAKTLNLSLLFIHAWNLIGEEENYNAMRGSIFLGVGGTYSKKFLGGLLRAGYEWRLGKHFATSLNLGYRPKASSFLGVSNTTIMGMEYGLGVSLLF